MNPTQQHCTLFSVITVRRQRAEKTVRQHAKKETKPPEKDWSHQIWSMLFITILLAKTSCSCDNGSNINFRPPIKIVQKLHIYSYWLPTLHLCHKTFLPTTWKRISYCDKECDIRQNYWNLLVFCYAQKIFPVPLCWISISRFCFHPVTKNKEMVEKMFSCINQTFCCGMNTRSLSKYF